jgi:hypothetical protein
MNCITGRCAVTARSRVSDFTVVRASSQQYPAVHLPNLFRVAGSRVLERTLRQSGVTQRRRNFSLAKVGVERSNRFTRSNNFSTKKPRFSAAFSFSGRLKSQLPNTSAGEGYERVTRWQSDEA